jgi:hypothetical protein
VGPPPMTAASNISQGIAPGATQPGSQDELITWPQTVLEPTTAYCLAGRSYRTAASPFLAISSSNRFTSSSRRTANVST